MLAELVDRQIVLDVCPTSNVRTGAVTGLDTHPLPQLFASGVKCSISTDDPAMFDTDLGREYALFSTMGGDARAAYGAGLQGALCDDTTRQHLAAIGDAARFWPG